MAAGVNRVRGVRFAALGEAEVRELAVCRVVSPAAFDAGGRVVPGGLYDSRMGPLDKAAGKCRTCQLMFQHCPGHLGYLEFAMVSRGRPVFPPLRFPPPLPPRVPPRLTGRPTRPVRPRSRSSTRCSSTTRTSRCGPSATAATGSSAPT